MIEALVRVCRLRPARAETGRAGRGARRPRAAGASSPSPHRRAAHGRRHGRLVHARVRQTPGASRICSSADRDSWPTKTLFTPALAALEEVERLAPADPRLPAISRRESPRRATSSPSLPERACSIKPYDESSQPWRLLGQTPIKDVRTRARRLPLEDRTRRVRAARGLRPVQPTVSAADRSRAVPAEHAADPGRAR